MLNSFVYSVNVILPVFLLVVLGVALKRAGWIGEGFSRDADKLVFRFGLPAMLFLDAASAGGADALDPGLLLFVFVAVSGSFAAVTLVVCLAVRDNGKRGAMIQGICRSNFAILGVPLIENMFGDGGVSLVSFVIPVTIILFNVYSVIVLSVFSPREKKQPASQTFRAVCRNIVTNPLIIAVILGIPFLCFPVTVPLVIERTAGYLSDMTTALALISLGSTFRRESFRGRVGYALTSALSKTVLLPAVTVTAAALLGMRGAPLGIVLVLFGAPTAVSSYIMAKNMNSDHELAGQILLLTTLFCLFTVFLGVFVLRSLCLI